MFLKKILPISFLCFLHLIKALPRETLPIIVEGNVPEGFEEMWKGFDPRKEPLEVEILKEWEEDDVILKVVRYRIGYFKGNKAMMAGVFGFPKGSKNIPGLLQMHGGGQYADYKAPLTNAKRGYATLSIAWAGRISAPQYRVSPSEVKLFWDGEINDSRYKVTTDWGALDAYHAPSRFGKDAFPSIPVADWTLDPVVSPRNNSWFLITIAARRGLTFLEQQPEVDSEKIGVYGHSMGGKLTVLTAGSDKRVKAAAPSCGGISDRYSSNQLHLATVSDPPSLKKITCPIIFLSPSNDFHGRINDLETAINEIKSKEWRITSSPHHNHQDTAEYEVVTQLWFDQYLKNSFSFPQNPKLNLKLNKGEIPTATFVIDESEILSVDLFYTQQGQIDGLKDNSTNTKNRFWHHVKASKLRDNWGAELPIFSTTMPLWVYGNVTYKLPNPVSGAGYYYGEYTADRFVISSLMKVVSPSEMKASQSLVSMKPQQLIEDFKDDWQKEWFSYKPAKLGISTHKIYDPVWKAPSRAKLSFDVFAEKANRFVVSIDSYATEIAIEGAGRYTKFELDCSEFTNAEGRSLQAWDGIKELRLREAETLRPGRGSDAKPKKLGGSWNGKVPTFRNLRWVNN
jgi:hypothetical protein